MSPQIVQKENEVHTQRYHHLLKVAIHWIRKASLFVRTDNKLRPSILLMYVPKVIKLYCNGNSEHRLFCQFMSKSKGSYSISKGDRPTYLGDGLVLSVIQNDSRLKWYDLHNVAELTRRDPNHVVKLSSVDLHYVVKLSLKNCNALNVPFCALLVNHIKWTYETFLKKYALTIVTNIVWFGRIMKYENCRWTRTFQNG